MGQKSNLITIRNNDITNLVTHNSKNWVSFYKLINYLKRLFEIKYIIINKSFFNISNNVFYINFYVFYQNIKFSFYKNKIIKKSYLDSLVFIKEKFLLKLFSQYKKLYNISVICLKMFVLNRLINKSFLTYFRFVLKGFNNLFIRRFNLFIDFVKVIVLFIDSYINLNFFISFLSRLFKFLSKRTHTKFLTFVKELLNAIIKFEGNKNIKGFKFLINGKIRGKDRASSKLIQVGKIPMQSISKKIEYTFSHVYTLYGVFGFKIWIYRLPNS